MVMGLPGTIVTSLQAEVIRLNDGVVNLFQKIPGAKGLLIRFSRKSQEGSTREYSGRHSKANGSAIQARLGSISVFCWNSPAATSIAKIVKRRKTGQSRIRRQNAPIKSKSRVGPVFFAHERVGRNGITFRCLKFRMMVVGAEECLAEYLKYRPEAAEEWKTQRKLAFDPRITTLGAPKN